MKGPYKLWTGDCREVVGYGYAENTFDSIVTDPPYGLEFMGHGWDRGVPGAEFWKEALRVAKPGAYLLAFGGTRTYHRLTCAIEDAGWEIRDCIMWVYSTGFPKSHDVSKAIDKAAGCNGERGPMKRGGERLARLADGKREGEGRWGDETGRNPFTYVAATDAAKQWSGWGTALKPAWEPIIVAQKPMKTTVAQNVQKYGTGGVNIDGCRVGTDDNLNGGRYSDNKKSDYANCFGTSINKRSANDYVQPAGRWPANLIHDGSEEVLGLFPETGPSRSGGVGGADPGMWSGKKQTNTGGHDDNGGSAARFFYCAKTSKRDRNEGCEGLEPQFAPTMGNGIGNKQQDPETATPKRNHHPTVKPTALMRYLIRLVTQPGGLVLDPFLGSGSTGKAAMLEGMRFVGVDRNAEYVEIAKARIEHALATRTEPEEE